MNFSDSIFAELASRGINKVFAVPGGGNMFLLNAACSNPQLEVIFCHNEQAAAIAAEGYYKVSRTPAVCLVTSGPGCTNAITGIVGAWLDSSSMIVLAGQVKTDDLKVGELRQKGPQEIDFVRMMAGYCLVAHEFKTSNQAELMKVLNQSECSPRGGPVVLSVPLDVQNSRVEFDEQFDSVVVQSSNKTSFDFCPLFEVLSKSSRPAILFGEGCRDISPDMLKSLFKLCEKLRIACLFSWLSYDLLPWDSPANMGRPGNVAKRHSNFVVQTSDVLIILGSRLDHTQTAFDANRFGVNATPYLIDVDQNELDKMPARFNKILSNSSVFATQFVEFFMQLSSPPYRDSWWDYCQSLKAQFGRERPVNASRSALDIDEVVDFLSTWIPAGATIVTGSSGLSVEIFHVGFRNKADQRIFLTTALGAMGFGLPAAIGVAQVARINELFLFESDGSLMMNLQELATLRGIKKRILIFLINNNGYASIRSSQQKHFGKSMGTDASSGLLFPNFREVIQAFGLDCYSCSTMTELRRDLENTADLQRPLIFELLVHPDSELLPKCGVTLTDSGITSNSMENMDPPLNEAELMKLLAIVKRDES